MNIPVIGASYVELVTATVLAEIGHQVICLDRDKRSVPRRSKQWIVLELHEETKRAAEKNGGFIEYECDILYMETQFGHPLAQRWRLDLRVYLRHLKNRVGRT
ncbi:hypothetical protein HCA46_09945 [Listeria booriae]|uniref:UDP-glucose/GDP-mannose dehydrogenase N-terminal domain-containing protein n=2 Tax=Listeria booriae TaxID=1552123 RepID=A0A7X0XR30_9LIST|nr:hypothetical protein [Listeria booriae]